MRLTLKYLLEVWHSITFQGVKLVVRTPWKVIAERLWVASVIAGGGLFVSVPAINPSREMKKVKRPNFNEQTNAPLQTARGKSGFTFIDLFAGIGGIRIAFERAGGECVFSSEWDKASQDTYEANFGERPKGDITKIPTSEIPNHDILTGGFPCQAFSVIGSRKGFADTRGTLFFEIERILKDKQPKAFLLENVRQLVTHDHGQTFKVILDSLDKLGYHVHYKILNGLNFSVPQKRERIIIVGFKENYPFEFPTSSHRPTQTLIDILEPEETLDKKHLLSDYSREKLHKKIKDFPTNPTVWHENKSGNIGIHDFSCALRANGSYNYLVVNGTRRLTPREMLRLQGFPDTFKMPVVDTQARKQAGNSVVVPKIEAVALAMVKAMKQEPLTKIEEIK